MLITHLITHKIKETQLIVIKINEYTNYNEK